MSGFKPRTWTVELYQGDWQQRLEDAARAVEKATRANRAAASLDEESEVDVLTREYNTLRDAAASERVMVTLQAISRKAWSELVAANPPRTDESVSAKDREYDAELGVNDLALGDALVPMSIVSIEPEMSKDDLLDALSSAQFDILYGRAFELNRGVPADPKAVPRLTHSPSSDATGN